MTNEERDDLLLGMRNDLSKHDELLLGMRNDLSKHDELLLEMSEKLSKHDELLLAISQEINSIHEEMDSIHANIGSLDAKVGKLEKGQRKIFGVLEDHGDKIQLLLESVGNRTQTITEVNQTLESHDKELYEHDIRIRVLESKVDKSKVSNL